MAGVLGRAEHALAAAGHADLAAVVESGWTLRLTTLLVEHAPARAAVAVRLGRTRAAEVGRVPVADRTLPGTRALVLPRDAGCQAAAGRGVVPEVGCAGLAHGWCSAGGALLTADHAKLIAGKETRRAVAQAATVVQVLSRRTAAARSLGGATETEVGCIAIAQCALPRCRAFVLASGARGPAGISCRVAPVGREAASAVRRNSIFAGTAACSAGLTDLRDLGVGRLARAAVAASEDSGTRIAGGTASRARGLRAGLAGIVAAVAGALHGIPLNEAVLAGTRARGAAERHVEGASAVAGSAVVAARACTSIAGQVAGEASAASSLVLVGVAGIDTVVAAGVEHFGGGGTVGRIDDEEGHAVALDCSVVAARFVFNAVLVARRRGKRGTQAGQGVAVGVGHQLQHSVEEVAAELHPQHVVYALCVSVRQPVQSGHRTVLVFPEHKVVNRPRVYAALLYYHVGQVEPVQEEVHAIHVLPNFYAEVVRIRPVIQFKF